MLSRLTFAQIGDIHLPTMGKALRKIDDKDNRFPVGLRNLISAQPMKVVFERLYRFVVEDHLSAAIFMGDFTDLGKLKGYEACAKFIAGALQLGTKGIHPKLPVGIVPGNHDIDRELAKKSGLTTKFRPLLEQLANAGLPSLPVTKPIWLSIGKDSAKAQVALLNSCWGCGAKEFIPEEFRKDVSAAIDKAISKGNSEKAARAYYDRQFDTPAFNTDTIQQLASDAATIPGNEVVLVCAHHNLLPQRISRLAPYTELLNSGAVRGVLSELKRPIVYLHGHIHEDPIEIVASPLGDPIVCISAPEASAGFNLVEVVYTSAGLPLSCHILKWRFDASGVFRQTDRVVVSLLGRRRRSHDPTLQQVYVNIVDAGEMYWATLIEKCQSIFANEAPEKLEEALELLSADGRVEIANYTLPSANWIVSAKI